MRTHQDHERGEALRDRREELDLSQEEVAKRLGVHRNSPGGWEKGRPPNKRNQAKLRELYQLPEDFFYNPLTDYERRLADEIQEMREQLRELLSVPKQMEDLLLRLDGKASSQATDAAHRELDQEDPQRLQTPADKRAVNRDS